MASNRNYHFLRLYDYIWWSYRNNFQEKRYYIMQGGIMLWVWYFKYMLSLWHYLLLLFLSFYLLHRREVTRLSQKLQTLLHSFTHAELTLDFPSSDITDLVNALNELFRVYHKQVYSLQKKDEAIKENNLQI